MIIAVSFTSATGCAWRCTWPKNPCMCPQLLTLCICVFTSGKPMTCIHGWMPAIPPLALQTIMVGPAACNRLRHHAPLFRKSRQRSVRCSWTTPPPPARLVAYIHDASCYPVHYHTASALTVLNLLTTVYHLNPVHVPIFCNNSYQAEVYVAWVVLPSRVPSASAWREDTWTFSHSQSYATTF